MIIFAPFTLWFWLLILVAIGLVIYALEESDDNGITWATVTMVAMLVLLYFFGSKQTIVDCFHFIVQRPGTTLILIAGYVALGVVWSFVKWFIFIRKKKDKIMEKHKDKTTFTEYDARDIKYAISSSLSVSNHKGKIISWMTYWPISLLWNMINDPVRKMFTFIYGRVQGMYGKMSARIEKKMLNELDIDTKMEKPGDKKITRR
jgi:hypothetical protein